MLMLPFYKRRVISHVDTVVVPGKPNQWCQRFLLIDSVRCDLYQQRSQ